MSRDFSPCFPIDGFIPHSRLVWIPVKSVLVFLLELDKTAVKLVQPPCTDMLELSQECLVLIE